MKRPSQKKLKKKLFNAVYDDNLPAVYEALSDGVDIDSRDEDGWTALMIAADKGLAFCESEAYCYTQKECQHRCKGG